MPFHSVPSHFAEVFWVLNPDPHQLHPSATPSSIASNPLNPSLPTLLFIHAAGANILYWQTQLKDPRLATKFNILLVDAPFHGFSRAAKERTDATLEESAECIVSLLDALELPDYSIYSEGVHGVNCGVHIALRRPENVRGLLLASPGWRRENDGVKQSLIEVEEATCVNKVEGGDGSLPPEALDDIVVYCIGASKRMGPARKEMAEYFQKRYGTGHPPSEWRTLFSFVYNREPISAEKLATVTCPVLLLNGGDDSLCCPRSAVEEWKDAFVNAKGGASIITVASAPSIISMTEGNVLARIQSTFFSSCAAETTTD